MTARTSPAPRDVKVAAVQIAVEQAWSDESAVTKNATRILDAYLDVADDVDLVVFPELSLTGYIPLKGYDQQRKRALSRAAVEAAQTALPTLVEQTRGHRALMVVGLMEPATMRNEIFNSVVLLQDGEMRAVYRKVHLPVEENHYFTPGDRVAVCDTRLGRIGLMICYDMLFPELARHASLLGAELLLVVSNWLRIGNLERLGEILPVARALEGQCHVVFVNGVGELEARGRTWPLYGTSRIISALGETIAVAGAGEETLVAVLRADDLERASDVFPVLRDRRPELYGHLVAPATEHAELSS